MKIGIFDSGMGGLVVLQGLLKDIRTGKYDYIFLADTKNLPYGDKSQEQIYRLTSKAVEYLFKKDCAIVMVACNTASSQALRRIQRNWLPKSGFRDRKVLGIIRPTVEKIEKTNKLGIIGTKRTIDSKAYERELSNLGFTMKPFTKATPKLVPMIESGKYDEKTLREYLKPFGKVDTLVLACTHYGLVKSQIQKIVGPKVKIIAQEDLLPGKLNSYLIKHKQLQEKIGKDSKVQLLATQLNSGYKNFKLVKY